MLKSIPAPPAAAFVDIDSVLDEGAETVVAEHVSRGETLEALGESITNSYEGHPDMVRTLLNWCKVVSLDEKVLLREAAANTWRSHASGMSEGLERLLLSKGRPHPLLWHIAKDSYWRTIAASIASNHPSSALAYQLDRERRLIDANISSKIFESPASVVRAIRDMFNTTLSENAVSNQSLQVMYDCIALIASYDECVAFIVLHFFGNVARHAVDPMVRSITRTASFHVRNSIAELSRQAVCENASSSQSAIAQGRRYAVHLNLVVDSIVYEIRSLDRVVLDAILSLLLSPDKSSSARRRLDKQYSVLRSTYSTLIGNLVLVDGEQQDTEGGGMTMKSLDPAGNGGKIDDNDEVMLVDDCSTIRLNNDVVETVSGVKASPEMKFILMRALCYPEIRDDVVKALFTSEFNVSTENAADERRKRCLSLMLAVSGVAASETNETLLQKVASEDGMVHLRNEIAWLYRRIRVVCNGCWTMRPKPNILRLHKSTIDMITREVKQAIVAHGVMAWAISGLQVNDRAMITNCTKHLAVLEVVITHHPLLVHPVMNALHDLFVRDFKQLPVGSAHEIRDMLMSCLSNWSKLRIGYFVLTIFHSEWAADTRISDNYLCIFVEKLLQSIAPPFLPAFSDILMSVLQHPRVEQALNIDQKLLSMALDIRKQVYESVR